MMQFSLLSRQVGAGVLLKYVLYIIGAANDGKDEMHCGNLVVSRKSCLILGQTGGVCARYGTGDPRQHLNPRLNSV